MFVERHVFVLKGTSRETCACGGGEGVCMGVGRCVGGGKVCRRWEGVWEVEVELSGEVCLQGRWMRGEVCVRIQ